VVGAVRRRRDDYADDTRRALIQSAEESFARAGYLRTSLDDVAEGARVSKGAIYHHFENKGALYEAALTRICAGLVAGIEADLVARPQPVTATDVLESYLTAACTDPFRRLALQEGHTALGWERWRRVSEECVVLPFGDLLEQRVGAAAVPPVPRELFLPTLVSALNELALAVTSSADPAQAREQSRRLVAELAATVRPT
jgi:AcrR family transcriptional regulator